jgi:hypothetical protein
MLIFSVVLFILFIFLFIWLFIFIEQFLVLIRKILNVLVKTFRIPTNPKPLSPTQKAFIRRGNIFSRVILAIGILFFTYVVIILIWYMF